MLGIMGFHGWHHFEVLAYVLILVLLFYKPPQSLQSAWAAQFIDSHFGDMIGFYILHLAVGLIVIGAVFNLIAVSDVGKQLLLPAMAVLKLTKSNGNGGDHPAPTPTPAPIAAPADNPAPQAPPGK